MDQPNHACQSSTPSHMPINLTTHPLRYMHTIFLTPTPILILPHFLFPQETQTASYHSYPRPNLKEKAPVEWFISWRLRLNTSGSYWIVRVVRQNMYQVHKSILRKQRDSSPLGLPAHCFVSFFAIVLHEIRHEPPSLHCHTTKTIIHYNKYITLHINLSNKHHLRKACPTKPHRGSTPLTIAIRLLHRPKRL